MIERTSLGVLLKRYRAAAGLSQESLAARAGISVRAISDVERSLHRAPHADTLDRLCTALALSAQQRAVLLAAAHPMMRDLTGEVALDASPDDPKRGLPLAPTALIGRERERIRAVTLLRGDRARLLTLTGPGGVGKTRLVIEITADLAGAFRDGVAFVELASTSDVTLVPGAIALALGLRVEAAIPIEQQLSAFLRDRQILLVLDNFEHLLDAAPVVADLLAHSPRLACLITSRAPLRLR
ncbi:MAG: helix-turn-helix domain-containing protein, partial [Ktedonobacterales bacterium]